MFLAFIASVGIFYVLALPAIVTALVDGLGFSDQQAGYVSSANAYGSMTGALIAVLLVRSCDWKKTVAAMFVVMIAMEIVTTKISSPGTMAAWRFVSGAVGGCSVGIGLAVLARLRHPDRAFGLLFLEQFGLGGFLILLRPLVIPYLGVTGIFVMLAVLMLIGLLAIPFLDDYEVEETTDSNRSKLPPFYAVHSAVSCRHIPVPDRDERHLDLYRAHRDGHAIYRYGGFGGGGRGDLGGYRRRIGAYHPWETFRAYRAYRCGDSHDYRGCIRRLRFRRAAGIHDWWRNH